MQRKFIQEKLKELNVNSEDIDLGMFDYIGRYTAERQRNQDHPLFKSVGAFYRSNYERGILIHSLIKKLNCQSFLEIGFGRGYATVCAALAFHEMGIQGNITTIDPSFDEKHVELLGKVFPKEWFGNVTFMQGKSSDMLPKIDDKFDLVYIDGDHSYEGTKSDWELTKDKYNKCLLFDDYHEASMTDHGIQCNKLIDEIDDNSKELIIMDRRIYFDDRRIPDNEMNYGQVLLTRGA